MSMNTTPLLTSLEKHVVPQYAVKWRVIGMELGLKPETLDIIEYDNVWMTENCCKNMLKKWLEVDSNASWEKLVSVTESLPLSSLQAVNKAAVEGTVSFDEVKHKTQRPTMRDLNRYVTRKYASDWYDIGIELGLELDVLDVIKNNNPQRSVTCLQHTLDKWLKLNCDDATWEALEVAITNVHRANLKLNPVDDVYSTVALCSEAKAKYEGLQQFNNPNLVCTTPLLRDLYQHITPLYAADWKVIGTLLGIPTVELKVIEAGYPTNVKWCCNQMLERWLEMDRTASWEKLFTVIESPAISSGLEILSDHIGSGNPVVNKGVNAITTLSEIVRKSNVRERFYDTAEETWPPDQPKDFTPLVLIRHQGQHSIEQTTAMTQFIQTGDIGEITSLSSTHHDHSVFKHRPKLDSHRPLQEVLDNSMVTKELAEILAPLEQYKEPQFILVEGAPGIGKSILLKEIAYRWGNKQLLKTFKLVLLVPLRDPNVQQAVSVSDLLQNFCEGNRRAMEIAAACHDHLSENGGKDLMFLFDGFDEFPAELQKSSLITKILSRKVLPCCTLVVSSRPHATVHLRERAEVRVDILGFTKIEQSQFIHHALEEQLSITELTCYLNQHPIISSLCTIPFHLVVLLYLYKQKIPLPNNYTELYQHFILLTICRHLAKCGHPVEGHITDLNSLPCPYGKIVHQLSKLSLEALNNNKSVFSLDEIKMACPDITAIPGAINGFGLLQAVQHFGLTGTTMTFSFLHVSLQEYLAAHYVASLPYDEVFQMLEEKFWSKVHFNMFTMYLMLTKGQQHAAYMHFISVECDKFQNDALKCLRLFRCFYEANDHYGCKHIEMAQAFGNKRIDLSAITLSPFDIENLAIFLSFSCNKKWEGLYLHNCQITDNGLSILHHMLIGSGITIKFLQLSFNCLTSVSLSSIAEIGISCEVKILRIGNNNLVESKDLCTILSDSSSMIETLGMESINLSSCETIKIFTALKVKTTQLKVLFIYNNNITDEASDAIVEALKVNTVLVELWIGNNPLSGDAAQYIVHSLRDNNTLTILRLPVYAQNITKLIQNLQEEVNQKREERGCQVKLYITFL